MDSALYRDHADLEERHWWFEGRRRVIASVLDRHLPRGASARLLDVGCGTGGMLSLLRDFGHASGIDLSPEAVQLAQERHGAGVAVHVGGIPGGLPGPGSLDVVTAFDVVEHIEDDLAAVTALREVLVPGGFFVCTVPAFGFLWSEHDDLNHHKRRYTAPGLRALLEQADLEVVELSYFNTWLFPLVAGVRVARKRTGRRSGASDLALPPPLVNRMLTAVFGSERALVGRGRKLPFGVSLIAVARRRG